MISTITITDSVSLAALFNTTKPATAEDAAENPTDWTGGLWLAGEVYEVDAQATTTTRLVLATGAAAIVWSPDGEWCGGDHRRAVECKPGHWCVADSDSWTYGDDMRGVTRDWRSVNVWDANGYSDTTTYPTLDEAKAAYGREVEELERMSEELEAEHGDD